MRLCEIKFWYEEEKKRRYCFTSDNGNFLTITDCSTQSGFG